MERKRLSTNNIKAALLAALLLLGGGMSTASAAPSPAAKAKRSSVTKSKTMNTSTEKNTFATPDFAFPETVEKNARPEWEKALAERDGLKGLRAGLQLVVANNLISQDNFNRNIEMLDSAVRVMPPVYASLFRLLQADLYAGLYNRERWVYNQRKLPVDTFPADPRTWSKDLFAKRVFQLVMRAADNPADSRKVPLSSISTVLTDYSDAVEAGCSVNDFIVYKSTNLLDTFGERGAGVIPFGKPSAETETGFPAKCADLSSSLINTLVSYREKLDNKEALALALARKSEMLEGNEKAGFLKEWMERLKDSEADARIIAAYYNCLRNSMPEDEGELKTLYKEMKAWVERFPLAKGCGAVKYCIAALSQPKMRVSLPTQTLPGEPIKGSVLFENADKLYYLLVYSVPVEAAADGAFNVSKFPGNARFVKAVPVATEGTVPFSREVDIELEPLQAGYYVVVPSATPKLASNWKDLTDKWSLQPINVTDLAILTNYNSQNGDSGKIFVVNAKNQQPVKDAKVSILDNNGKTVKSGLTDEEGSFPLPQGYSRTQASFGGSYASTYSGFYSSKREFKPTPQCNILTDLSIYRPGDEMKFVLVTWLRDKLSNRLLAEESVKVVLRDANYNPVDTLDLKTDKEGRINGSFTIPATGLLGSYSLCVFAENHGKNMIGSTRFEVAEYKTPGFLVTLEKGDSDSYEAGDTITFKGSVKTYSGMPLGDAKVDYKITWQPWWRWGGDYINASYGNSLTTDSEGNFKIELPTAALKGTRFEHGIFTLLADATSASGETQQAPALRFSLGRDYSVQPMFADKVEVKSDSIRLNVPVYDILGMPAIKKVEYRVEKYSPMVSAAKEIVATGAFVSPALEIPSSLLPSGKYKLVFSLEGDTLKTERDLVVFREDDSRPPYQTPLWVPKTSYIAKEKSDKVEVKFGSGYADSWVLAVVSDADGIVSRRWIQLSDENTVINVPTPGEGAKTWVTLSGLHDFEQKTSVITVEPASAAKKLEVKASTFREQLTAGSKEKWKFNFTVDDMAVADIPAFAVMTDKALNAIAPFSWTFTPDRNFVYNATSLSRVNTGFAFVSARFAKTPKYVGFENFIPSWNTYGYGLGMETLMRVYATSRSLSIKGGAVMADSVVDEVYEAAAPVMMNAAVMKSEPQMSMKKAAYDIEEEVADDSAVVTGDAGEGKGSREEVELRPMEMPLAFFIPDLKGDGEGNVEVEFEVPNFNTTWQFQIYGYTPDLLTVGLTLDAVASKKVMVQTNAPRFLRTGDKAQISALVFNNSDTAEKLDGEIVIFNPLTNETLYSFHQGMEMVQPSGNRKITVDFLVPSDIEMLGIRSIGSSSLFSDGEQTVIPVLPSSTPVVESTQFYLGKERESFSTRLPKYQGNANLTLRYCTDPVWECILALPSITTPDSKNVLTLMQALYANATASSIVKRYPQVKEGLSSLFAGKGSGEELKSNLEKNSSLKTVALNNTPWVNNATSETLRLNSLSELISGDAAGKAVEALLKDVKGLQNSDGGWSWCNGMKSSEFITRNVLSRFAMLNNNGTLPSEARQMVKKGINFCDSKAYSSYVESKHQFSTVDMLHYLYIRSGLDAGNGSAGFAGLKEKALKAIADEWKEFGIEDKAKASMVMARSKGYKKTAGVILESLRQYAVKDSDKGWNYANLSSGSNGWGRLSVTAAVLEAFAEIEPKAEAVDGLRQWLVLQKETEDWGANSNTVEVIQAILQSGSDWTEAETAPKIYLGGKEIKADKGERLTGIVTVPLSPKQASGKELKIEKNSQVPAWGAVISQYVSPIKDIRNEACENLKIEKSLLVINSDATGEKAKQEELSVGDKVRVTLTVTCDKDMNYVAITDERSACLSPDEQLSGYTISDGLGMYREVRDTKTSLFIDFLPKGVNVITYDCHVDRAGEYANGIATIQSQYSPQQVAHSAGGYINVK